MRRIVMLVLLASLLVSTASAASFALYVDDNGGPSDVILATNVMTQAEAKTSALPKTGYTALFSDYTSPQDLMLVISHGHVWVVAGKNADRTAEVAIVQTLAEQHIDYNLTATVPSTLESGTPTVGPGTNASAPQENGSSAGACTAADEHTTYCDDNTTVKESCTCTDGNLRCTTNTCPSTAQDTGSSGAPDDGSAAPEANATGPSDDTGSAAHPSFFARVFGFLFGWLR